MRQKHIYVGMGSVIVIILAIMCFAARSVYGPTGNLPEPPTPSKQNTTGVVMADDETPNSPPKSITVGPPQTPTNFSTYINSSPRKLTTKYVTIDNKEYPLRTYRLLTTPNDPLANQWWVTNAKMDQAWNIPRGNHPTMLAVIDTGFALKHEDLANRWYQNIGETGPVVSENPSRLNCTDRGLALDESCNLIDDDHDGIVDNENGPTLYQNASQLNCTARSKPLAKDCNLIDDDGNGYADDVTGWDFADGDNSAQAGELNSTGAGTKHGTMTAGIAAASGNNGLGSAGVDWGTTVLPIQALDDDGYGDTITVGKAIRYAVAQGANVINISLGSDLPDDYVRQSIAIALAHGVTVVASSGNDGCNCMVYPANYPEVVAVGALDSSGNPASYSSWGSELDIMAPGSQITGPSWSNSKPTNAYATGSGTSFSAPIVSGLLTRLLSNQPTATPLQLIAALTETTNHSSITQPPRNDTLGFGILNAQAATSRMTTPNSEVQAYDLGSVSRGNYLVPLNPAEAIGSYRVEPCSQTTATTPLYELTKGSARFFTVSRVEKYQAQALGYGSSLFTYACLSQPHDTADIIRTIDVFSEFRNIVRVH